MEKSEIKTCGNCIHFRKSSCMYLTSKEDWLACAEYQETYHTLSATSQTKEISKPIMKEEQKKPLDYYEFTNVYKVNDDVIVANTIEEAIELWKKSRLIGYDSDNIKKVELMYYDAKIKSAKDDENITANMQDCVSSKNYVVQCDYTAKADEKD